jgi:hypothetical protein
MIVALAALVFQVADPTAAPPAPAPASASLVVEGAVAVSSVAPILMKDGRIDGPVVIDVGSDPGRAFRLQVQATVVESSGLTHVVSDASGELGVGGTARTGADGLERLRIFGATPLLREGSAEGSVLPLRIVYE